MLKMKLYRLLDHFGMLPHVERIKNLFCMVRYAHRKRFAVTVNGCNIVFSTEDGYSKKLFYTKRGGLDLFEPVVVEKVAERTKTATVFADVGAHIGYYSCIAGIVNPDVRVFSFEMNQNLIGIVRKNIEVNKIHNATVIHGAVSDTADKVFYRSGTYTAGERMLYEKELAAEQNYQACENIVLDEFFISNDIYPDLMKIDVEGAEAKVLRGATRILEKARPIIFLEVHPYKLQIFGDDCDDLLQFLAGYHYEISRMQLVREKGEVLKREDTALCLGNEMLLCTPKVVK